MTPLTTLAAADALRLLVVGLSTLATALRRAVLDVMAPVLAVVALNAALRGVVHLAAHLAAPVRAVLDVMAPHSAAEALDVPSLLAGRTSVGIVAVTKSALIASLAVSQSPVAARGNDAPTTLLGGLLGGLSGAHSTVLLDAALVARPHVALLAAQTLRQRVLGVVVTVGLSPQVITQPAKR
jgi:hypothetical protein